MHEDPTRRMPIDDGEPHGSPRAGGDPGPPGDGGGMSTQQKVAIGLVVAVVIGLIIALIALAANGDNKAVTTTLTTTSEPTTTESTQSTSTTEPTSTSESTSTSTSESTTTTTTTETTTGGGVAP